jgi:hypothetical protein
MPQLLRHLVRMSTYLITLGGAKLHLSADFIYLTGFMRKTGAAHAMGSVNNT